MRKARQNLPFHEFRHAVHEQHRTEGNADRYALGRIAEHGQQIGDERKDRFVRFQLRESLVMGSLPTPGAPRAIESGARRQITTNSSDSTFLPPRSAHKVSYLWVIESPAGGRLLACADRLCEAGQHALEQRLADGAGNIPRGCAARRFDEACHIKSFEAMMVERDGAFANGAQARPGFGATNLAPGSAR